mmetsp:Transcript_5103/g.10574  ORF Transcript_5103/g.10574 Transcript_5103/m.10574 type:complete len:228 (-) Transcript_5103:56-739(-)
MLQDKSPRLLRNDLQALRWTTRLWTILSQQRSKSCPDYNLANNPQAHWRKVQVLPPAGSQGRPGIATAAGPQGTRVYGTSSIWKPQDILPAHVGSIARALGRWANSRGCSGRCDEREGPRRGRSRQEDQSFDDVYQTRRAEATQPGLQQQFGRRGSSGSSSKGRERRIEYQPESQETQDHAGRSHQQGTTRIRRGRCRERHDQQKTPHLLSGGSLRRATTTTRITKS